MRHSCTVASEYDTNLGSFSCPFSWLKSLFFRGGFWGAQGWGQIIKTHKLTENKNLELNRQSQLSKSLFKEFVTLTSIPNSNSSLISQWKMTFTILRQYVSDKLQKTTVMAMMIFLYSMLAFVLVNILLTPYMLYTLHLFLHIFHCISVLYILSDMPPTMTEVYFRNYLKSLIVQICF